MLDCLTPYVILALPRSRTYWCSRFLTAGRWTCGHDEAKHWRSFEDVNSWFRQECIGTAETAIASFWRLIPPEVRIVTIRRPVSEVLDSLSLQGFPVQDRSFRKVIEQLDRKLDQVEKRRDAQTFTYDDLKEESECARLFEYCLPYHHQHDRWERMAAENLQIDMQALLKYTRTHMPQMLKMAKAARQRIIQDLKSWPVEKEGITFQLEPFDDWIRDGTSLFAEHLSYVGEAPDAWQEKNLPLMRELYNKGCMQVMTARCNGRMLGYLMSLMSPSLETQTHNVGVHNTFYVSSDARGIGVQLIKHANKAMREAGVTEILMRAGERGDGPRLAKVFQRLGASEAGQWYRLKDN